MKNYVKIARDEGGVIECGEGKDLMPDLPQENKNVCIKFVRSRQPGIISLMSYSLLWFVKINTELLRAPRRSSVFIFTNQSNE